MKKLFLILMVLGCSFAHEDIESPSEEAQARDVKAILALPEVRELGDKSLVMYNSSETRNGRIYANYSVFADENGQNWNTFLVSKKGHVTYIYDEAEGFISLKKWRKKIGKKI